MKKTSYAKSHSKWSNFKLMLVTLFMAISVNLFWLILVFKESFEQAYFIMFLSLSISFILLGVLGLTRFKR